MFDGLVGAVQEASAQFDVSINFVVFLFDQVMAAFLRTISGDGRNAPDAGKYDTPAKVVAILVGFVEKAVVHVTLVAHSHWQSRLASTKRPAAATVAGAERQPKRAKEATGTAQPPKQPQVGLKRQV